MKKGFKFPQGFWKGRWKERNCELCRQPFQPTSTRHRLCVECVQRMTPAEHGRYKQYGLTPEAYQKLIDAHDGKCQLCFTSFEDRRPVVDHDHVTGDVRGILCHYCNRLLAGIDDATWLERAIKYVKKPVD